MDIIFQILFWCSFFALFHSYILFPIIINIIGQKKNEIITQYSSTDDNLPTISVILASYNEEKNIEKKIISTFKTNYPLNKIEFLIGSDNSTDSTNSIIKKYSEKYKQIKFYEFNVRQGKINIINQLKQHAKNQILVFTDTKVFFGEDTIFNLIKYFKDSSISLVGGVLNNQKIDKKGVSIQEDVYMNREIHLKYLEGLIWKCSMGVFGAIYAIRSGFFSIIPENFLVDDFFITMKVLENKGKVIFAKDSVSEENLTGNLSEEFKRKVRISIGNFQNLIAFRKILSKPYKKYVFTYISHKVLRWLGPFFLIIILIVLSFLLNILLYKILFYIFFATLLIPLVDLILIISKININILRFVTHFYSMNLALAIGFIKYITGNYKKIWEPSKR